MSLLVRLLTTGKSLVDLRDTASRYRMRQKNPLPKFGSAKNPFAARPGTQAGSPAPGAEIQAAPAGHTLSPAEVAAANLKETMRLPVLATASETKPAAKPQSVRPAKAKQPGRLGEWMQQLNPLKRWPKRNAAAKPAIPAFSKPPVQGELSLDNVKVMRNDLSDADVEIVPAKPVAKPAATLQAKPVAAIETTKAEAKAELAGVQAN